MKVEQLFTSCLAEMAYYIESNGEAAIIDPLRETEPYIQMAKADGATIKYVFLTHFHADFVSGQVDLAKKTGATIVFGPNADPNYEIHQATDGEEFKIGNVTLQLIHTPGHTMESSSYVLIDENGKKPYVFTGDCLFIGDVGRPDLAVKSDVTEADLAAHLYDSLRTKIMTLPDDIIVYPNHGAGSACGKKMSKETFDTLGNQKKTNYALRADMSKEEFIKEVLTGLMPAPQYFPNNVRMNKGINTPIDTILEKGTTPLDAATFHEMAAQKDVLVIDTRTVTAVLQEGTVPNAWYIGADGEFAPWVGTLVKDIQQKIIFIAEGGREHEIVTRFSRVGYDNVVGFLRGGMHAWVAAGFQVERVNSVSAPQFAKQFLKGELSNVLDVRKESEYLSEHVVGVENYPLDTIHANIAALDSNKKYYVHCAGGYRSLMAATILKSYGIENVTNIEGGFNDIKDTGVSLTDYVCPTTFL
ncbi:MAG: MBL fold metallo-hydrolase [Lutibacter sp.]|nr:MBL fold metallo-hydrolase [Lutibacter sp.]MBP9600415.1 MBL fold metallo-hydrolase [Lutibacter sp.]